MLSAGFPDMLSGSSHLTRGAWIEIILIIRIGGTLSRSHLTRGAWIEISVIRPIRKDWLLSHLTRGAWIEIIFPPAKTGIRYSRTSHEVRGLKFVPSASKV